jgi:plasmid stabilization system protein ParE
MTRPLIIRPAAEADIQEIYSYLEEVRPGIGEKFSASLQEVLNRIEANPEAFGTVWKDVRAVRVRRFQYVVYYIVFEERIELLAVIHGSRRESTWKSRS